MGLEFFSFTISPSAIRFIVLKSAEVSVVKRRKIAKMDGDIYLEDNMLSVRVGPRET